MSIISPRQSQSKFLIKKFIIALSTTHSLTHKLPFPKTPTTKINFLIKILSISKKSKGQISCLRFVKITGSVMANSLKMKVTTKLINKFYFAKWQLVAGGTWSLFHSNHLSHSLEHLTVWFVVILFKKKAYDFGSSEIPNHDIFQRFFLFSGSLWGKSY